MGSLREDILPFVGPRRRNDGSFEFFGYGLVHFVEMLMVLARVALDGLPDDYCIPSFLAHLRKGLNSLLMMVTVEEVDVYELHLADSFSNDDLLDITFMLDDPGRSANLLVSRVGVDLIDPDLLAGESAEADESVSGQESDTD